MGHNYDFGGWATRNDILCADGRTIRDGAFKDCDGQVVPLVWSHSHDNPNNVLGHALLENRPGEGVYAYGSFNDTEEGKRARELVRHKDIRALSIYANKLKQNAGDVVHGVIREVSLVLASANPGAVIDYPVLAHSGETSYEEAHIYTGLDIEPVIEHSDEEKSNDKKEDKDVADEKTSEKTIQDVFDSLTEEQKKVVYFLVGQAVEDAKAGDDKDSNNDEEDEKLKHNVFENDTNTRDYLSHDDFAQIMKDAKRLGSMRDAIERNIQDGGVLAHAVYNTNDDGTQGAEQTYGMANIGYLFPDARTINGTPEFIKRDQDWVAKVMNGTHHTPFSRVKSVFANITMDEARAKGYIKGKRKAEEVFTLLKRATTPQTIYKKQKLDRDDIIDITDFDVVAWIKGEMRLMLDEELARAMLVGDGRSPASDDKISEDHVRPIWTDDDLYTVKATVTEAEDIADTAKEIIRTAIKTRKDYKGSGNPVLFTTEDWLTEMLLLEDGLGHPLYKTEAELATKMRVREIIAVPVMENLTRTVEGVTHKLAGIIVNLTDYNVGADKGGAVNMFEDFDIDYNQEKYLIETRISGALTKPYSAIAIETIGA